MPDRRGRIIGENEASPHDDETFAIACGTDRGSASATIDESQLRRRTASSRRIRLPIDCEAIHRRGYLREEASKRVHGGRISIGGGER